MKIRLIKCCWFGSLRTACLIIGWYLVIFSALYLALLPFYKMHAHAPEDTTRTFLIHHGKYISGPAVLLQLAAGALDVIAVYKGNSLLMLISVLVFLAFIVLCIPLAIWTILDGAIGLFCNFILFTGINICLVMMLFSYYVDMKLSEARLSAETEISVQE